MADKKQKESGPRTKSAAEHLKEKQQAGLLEKPVFVVVEQNKFFNLDPYRVVLMKNVTGENNSINLDGIIYTLVTQVPWEGGPGSINAQMLRNWCQQQNPRVKEQRKLEQEKKKQEWEQKRLEQQKLREEEWAKKRAANHQERLEGSKIAKIIFKQKAILNAKMDEVETGEAKLYNSVDSKSYRAG